MSRETDTCPECGLAWTDLTWLAHVETHETQAMARLVDHFARREELARQKARGWALVAAAFATLAALVAFC